jgi:hypothetical protein
MNKLIRATIARKTDFELACDIDRWSKHFESMPKHLKTINASLSKRLQANIDEQQKRLLEQSALSGC